MIAYGLAIPRMHTRVHFPDPSGPMPRTGKELAVKLERVDSKHPMLLYEAGFTSPDVLSSHRRWFWQLPVVRFSGVQ